jgi:hypothetical protein
VLATVRLREALLELANLRPAESSPLTAAQRANKSLLFGLAENGPGRERFCSNRLSTK